MKKILAIDDSEINLMLLEKIIENNYPDFLYLQASKGIAGIELARVELPDLILLDITMPELNGFEVCKILKGAKTTKQIPVLLFSALGTDASIRIKGLNAGADAIIPKPYSHDELVAYVDVAVRIKGVEDLLRKNNKSLEENYQQIKSYQEKLKKLNHDINSAEEKERQRIAQNIHDSLGQTLSFTYMKLSAVQNSKYEVDSAKIVGETLDLLKEAISESRNIMNDLYPPFIYELGLIATLKWKLEQVEQKYSIKTIFKCEVQKLIIQRKFNILIYRIISELFANIIKHAKAKTIELTIKKESKMVEIHVRDDGKGFKIEDRTIRETGGFGLLSISERMESVNGYFEIKSKPGIGTIAVLKVPLLKDKNDN